ncbi:MAG: hypothetical protein U1E26_03265 [Coriobacteriia bacterium]|nr:hypothetical protein [Coriobacteriia bacterium]
MDKNAPQRGVDVSAVQLDPRLATPRAAGVFMIASSAPVLSIYSLHDNLVHPASTSQVEGESVSWLAVEGPGHLSVLFDRRVGDAVCAFLAPVDPVGPVGSASR